MEFCFNLCSDFEVYSLKILVHLRWRFLCFLHGLRFVSYIAKMQFVFLIVFAIFVRCSESVVSTSFHFNLVLQLRNRLLYLTIFVYTDQWLLHPTKSPFSHVNLLYSLTKCLKFWKFIALCNHAHRQRYCYGMQDKTEVTSDTYDVSTLT